MDKPTEKILLNSYLKRQITNLNAFDKEVKESGRKGLLNEAEVIALTTSIAILQGRIKGTIKE